MTYRVGEILSYEGRTVEVLSHMAMFAEDSANPITGYRVKFIDDNNIRRKVAEDELGPPTLEGRRDVLKYQRSQVLATLRNANARLREIDGELQEILAQIGN